MQRIRIVRPAGYPSRFNTPRVSDLDIRTRHWLPIHKIWKPAEVALFLASIRPGLIHTFNRIPIDIRRFVISYESHLPRLYDYPDGWLNDFFVGRLLSQRCAAIIPISDAARRTFLHQHRKHHRSDELAAKLGPTIYPSVRVDARPLQATSPGSCLKVVFIGSHFVRKGGLAILRAAEIASARKLPIEFHIVSNLTIGRDAGVWTDPKSVDAVSAEMSSLKLSNVVHHGAMPNTGVMALLRSADVALLPTLSDTFGYSILEAFSLGVPVIATNCYAIPEIVEDGINGRILPMELDELGQWRHLFAYDRVSEEEYVETLKLSERTQGARLANVLEELLEDRAQRRLLAEGAYETALTKFNAAVQARKLEELYRSYGTAKPN